MVAHRDAACRGMVVVFYFILFVAVLNMGLGVAVALFLGRRYRTISALVPASGFPEAPAPGLATQTPDAVSPRDSPPAAELKLESLVEAVSSVLPTPVGPRTGVTAQPQPKPQPEREKSPSETSVLCFGMKVERYHEQLAQIDDILRQCTQAPEPAEIAACLNSLTEANRGFLQQRDEAHNRFEEIHRERDEFNAARDTVRAAMGQQTQQIQSTNQAIDAFDYQADLRDGCRQMVNETSKLMQANHHLRDTLDQVMVGVARSENWLQSLPAPAQGDPLADILTLAGLEARLADWWEKNPHRVRQLCAAVIDLDQFSRVNERYGHRAGDAILHGVGQFFLLECRGETKVSRFYGAGFFFLFPDKDIRYATNLVERIRQVIELTHFRYRDSDIQVTASCAVTEANPTDTTETLFARVDATLKEAKRYGRNRSFVHEGKYPTPVVPPNFSLEEKQIDI